MLCGRSDADAGVFASNPSTFGMLFHLCTRCGNLRSVTGAENVEAPGFQVVTAYFTGTLGELAHALRTAKLSPHQLDVLQLVRDYLAYFAVAAEDNLELASEALPLVARVVELKIRFLLPRPPKDQDDEVEALLEEALEAVTLLEDLEDAIHFLKRRREARRVVLPAKTPRPDYPRPERPLKIGVDKLKQLASRYSFSAYFELEFERLTMAGAIKSLLSTLQRVRRGSLSDLVQHRTWANVAVTFAGLLELVKEGKVQARQDEVYGPITVELAEVQEKREAA